MRNTIYEAQAQMAAEVRLLEASRALGLSVQAAHAAARALVRARVLRHLKARAVANGILRGGERS